MRALAQTARRNGWLSVLVGLTATAVYVARLGQAATEGDYELWAALLILPVLLAVSAPLIRRAARVEGDAGFTRLLVVALVLKLAASLVRYYVAFDVYGGVADASAYAEVGAGLSDSFRHGDFDVDVGRSIPGTGFIRLLTGLIFTLTGPTTLGGFLVYSWLGFWGLYLFYRAFRVGFPEGDARRYRLLVFFAPSLLFWPSSIGKESWMLLTLGLAAYGAARLLEARPRGIGLLVLGLVGAGLVRPHMSALVLAGLGVAALRRRPRRVSPMQPVVLGVLMVVLLGLGFVAVSQTERFFGVEGEGLRGAEQVLDATAAQTETGGSRFEAVDARNPTQLPLAVGTVLFRPLPNEADNPQMLLAAAEGSVLLVLTLLSLGRLARLPRTAWRRPYLLFAIVYGLLFTVAFSTFGNFGILVRQRIQLLPLFFALLCLPAAVPERRPAEPVR